MQIFISLTFRKNLFWFTCIEKSKHTNKHKYTQTQKTHIHTYENLPTSKHTYINTCIQHTYIHINIYTRIHTYIYIYINIHTHIYIHA